MEKISILNDVKKIIESYNLKELHLPDDFATLYDAIRKIPQLKVKYSSPKDDSYFIKKYRDNIPKGWYGFSLGEPIFPEWCEIIDEVLELCIKHDNNFKIHQIKVKFGRVCFYTYSEKIDDLHDVEVLILNKLYQKALIY